MTTSDKQTAGSKPDHLLGDALEALPMHVRHIARVCRCGDLEAEHNLRPSDDRTRTGCSRLRCDCPGFEHTSDRYLASTYVTVPARETLPRLQLEQVRQPVLAGILEERQACHGSVQPHTSACQP